MVWKFGGSSVRDAERMREVAHIVCEYPAERPLIVLSAMGKTTNNLLRAGEKAMHSNPSDVPTIDELTTIRELHEQAMEELGVGDACKVEIRELLGQLERLLVGLSIMKVLFPTLHSSSHAPKKRKGREKREKMLC